MSGPWHSGYAFRFISPFNPVVSLCVSDSAQLWKHQVMYSISQNCMKWHKVDFELYFFVNYFLMSILKSCL